jgi:geranylgeranyl transferase type-2 subunit alpha
MWNWRKEACVANHPAPGAARETALVAELELTQAGLMVNPKSYCCWHHRRWAVEWGCLDGQLSRELRLCDKLLALDSRNFHCWQYRRFVVERAAVPTVELQACVDAHITSDFSNYSAWHERTRLLPIARAPVDLDGVRAELELVRNAFYTAPEDSSAWFYHRWLLSRVEAAGAAACDEARRSELRSVLESERGMVRELLEIEPDSKWPMLTGAHVCLLLGGEPAHEERHAWLARLSSIDPQRAAHYRHASAQQART